MKKCVCIVKPEGLGLFHLIKHFIDSVDFLLVGDKSVILSSLKDVGLDRECCSVVDISNDREAAEYAAKQTSLGEVDILMKGIIHTGLFIKTLLQKEYNLKKRNGALISLISRFTLPHYHKPLFLTDAGINIYPDIDQKKAIIQNSVDIMKALGMDQINIALLSPVEVVNPSIISTVEADQIKHDSDIEGVTVEGPISFDLAISKSAAEIKGFQSEVAGEADLLVVPNLDAGNMLYKSLVYMGGATVSGVVAGLKVPVVLTSRADSKETKINSLSLALEINLQE